MAPACAWVARSARPSEARDAECQPEVLCLPEGADVSVRGGKRRQAGAKQMARSETRALETNGMVRQRGREENAGTFLPISPHAAADPYPWIY